MTCEEDSHQIGYHVGYPQSTWGSRKLAIVTFVDFATSWPPSLAASLIFSVQTQTSLKSPIRLAVQSAGLLVRQSYRDLTLNEWKDRKVTYDMDSITCFQIIWLKDRS